jgi:dihydrofolate reductase
MSMDPGVAPAADRKEIRMRNVSVFNNVTLDGVMQAPAGKNEDTRGGFERGGWALPYDDAVKGQVAGEGMAKGGDLLFGRRTWQHMFKAWHGRTDNPFTEVLDGSRKYVASRTLKEPLEWENSTLLSGDAADAVAQLKQTPGNDLTILGSGELIRALMRRDLVDPPHSPTRAGIGSPTVRRRRHVRNVPPRAERPDDYRRRDRYVREARLRGSRMKLYLLSIYQPDGDPPPPDKLSKVMSEIDAMNRELKATGSWVFAGGLHPPSTATVIRVKDGETLLTDGPFTEGKEHIGGFTVIKAADLDAALEWGRRLAAATTLPIEVRPFQGVVD